MRILFVQHGRFAEDYERLAATGLETYRDQRASVMYVADLAEHHDIITLSITDDPFDVALKPSLRCIGIPYKALTARKTAWLFDEAGPDRLICRTPHHNILREAQRRHIATLPTFADIFSNKNPKALYWNIVLRRALIGDHIPCVANHSRNASLSVHKALLISKSKIVPWDRRVIQTSLAPKASIGDASSPKLFYAGPLAESKGVLDIMQALAILAKEGINASLSIAGRNEPEPWLEKANALGVGDKVVFLGLLSNCKVLDEMRAHDVVMVPTRHEYQEGMPNTLREALAVRTPLIISDHPAFQGRLRPEQDCLMFEAGSAEDLAAKVRRLVTESNLFAELSANAEGALERLPFGLYWDDLWRLFIDDPSSGAGWVKKSSLKALGL